MFFENRVLCIREVESPEELAYLLTERTWTLCSGFSVAGHPEFLFLNDSTCEDGLAEFAVIRGGLDAAVHRQVESLSFCWCTYQKALHLIYHALAGGFDRNHYYPSNLALRLETPATHQRCCFCS